MRITYIAFLLVLLTLSATAQDKKDATPQSSTSVLINGQPIQGKVLEMDGKHFVAVEDLAQSLRGTIAYGDSLIALTLPRLPSVTVQLTPAQAPSVIAPPSPALTSSVAASPSPAQPPSVTAQLPPSQSASVTVPPSPAQTPSVAAEPRETGGVKGTLTYFFDFHVGNKPDSGTKVWLVKGRAEIPANQTFVGTSSALGTSGNPEQFIAIKYSIADANGNFELLGIPPGQYTLVLQSAHTKGTLKEKRDYFSRGSGRNPRDASGRVEFLNLTIKAGETVDGSKDFGPNIDM
jgi:hypothetical protein